MSLESCQAGYGGVLCAAYDSHGLNTGTRALSKSLRSRVTTVSPK